MLIFNLLYFIATVVIYMDCDIPPIHLPKCSGISEAYCIPSHNSTIYKDELTAFTAKMLVLFIAFTTELLVAIKAHKKTALFTARWCHSSKCHRVFQIILLWNTFACVCTNLAGIGLSSCMYFSACHSTTNHLNTVRYSCNLCISSSNHHVHTTIRKSVLCQNL